MSQNSVTPPSGTRIQQKPKSRVRRWLIGCGGLIVVCLVFSVIGAIGQSLGILPDSTELAQTREARDLPTRIAAANSTRSAELTATMNARPTVTFTPSATFTASVTPLPSDTPAPTDVPAFNEQDYIDSLGTGLFILAGGRNISSIRVADGRDNGGERVAIIAYASTENTGDAMVSEMLDILSAVGATIDGEALDIDAVSLSIGNAAGQATALISVSVADIQLWRSGELTDDEFAERIQMTDF